MLLRNLIAAFMLLIMNSCATFGPAAVQRTVLESRAAVTHILYGQLSCSAFHIGDGRFITAAHCFGEDLGGPVGEVRMIDEHNFQYFPKIAKYSQKMDLVLLVAPDFKGPALSLWDNVWDGELPLGMEMVSMGYPGYYDLSFQFEHGYIKDMIDFEGVEMVVSEESSYSGESGGPAISTANGKVIGMVDAGVEQIQWYRFPTHIHVSLSLFVSAREIRAFLLK